MHYSTLRPTYVAELVLPPVLFATPDDDEDWMENEENWDRPETEDEWGDQEDEEDRQDPKDDWPDEFGDEDDFGED